VGSAESTRRLRSPRPQSRGCIRVEQIRKATGCARRERRAGNHTPQAAGKVNVRGSMLDCGGPRGVRAMQGARERVQSGCCTARMFRECDVPRTCADTSAWSLPLSLAVAFACSAPLRLARCAGRSLQRCPACQPACLAETASHAKPASTCAEGTWRR
jgi:hypothetical protein